jgi:DNA modification methylase
VSVLDLFAGGGFTIIAGEKLFKKTFNMELSEHYCDVIIKRWEQYTGKKATLELTGQTYEELKQERENG